MSTAKEFLKKKKCPIEYDGADIFFNMVEPKDLIEFAKLHVKAQKETIKKELDSTDLSDLAINSILNAYDESNIK